MYVPRFTKNTPPFLIWGRTVSWWRLLKTPLFLRREFTVILGAFFLCQVNNFLCKTIIFLILLENSHCALILADVKNKNQSQSRTTGRTRLVFTIDFDSWAALHAVCRLLKCCEQDFGQLVPSLLFHGASISFFCLLSKYSAHAGTYLWSVLMSWSLINVCLFVMENEHKYTVFSRLNI